MPHARAPLQVYQAEAGDERECIMCMCRPRQVLCMCMCRPRQVLCALGHHVYEDGGYGCN